MSSTLHPLVGCWRTDESEVESVREFGLVSMEFAPDGSLTYTIHEQGSDQVILLTYRVEGHVLITDQPSRPQVERTEFMFDDEGRLVLYFEGQAAFYRRVR